LPCAEIVEFKTVALELKLADDISTGTQTVSSKGSQSLLYELLTSIGYTPVFEKEKKDVMLYSF
jgi:hypothetical protein